MSDPIAELSHLRRCTRCALPETHESIIFDHEGVCNVCRQVEFKRDSIDWEERHDQLEQLIEQYRGKYDYDCIVPFSRGQGLDLHAVVPRPQVQAQAAGRLLRPRFLPA